MSRCNGADKSTSEGTLLIRADANVAIGTGHVMRCLALAQAWEEGGGKAVFAMAELLPLVRERLASEGMEIVSVEEYPGSREDATTVGRMAHRLSADWIVVDGYHFDAGYQRELKASALHVLAVDDDGRCEHYWADVVLNQNIHAGENLYSSREPYTRLLLGLLYILLRREFGRWSEWKRQIPEVGRRVLITMGGSDPDNVTSLAIGAFLQANIPDKEAIVVLGGSSPQLGSVQALAAQSSGSVRLLEDSSNMPELMAWADMALIAGGGTLWELLSMGCPVLSYARNSVQQQINSKLESEGLIRGLGDPQHCGREQAAAALVVLANSQELRANYSRLGRERVDGRGAGRVCGVLVSAGVGQL